MTHSDASPQTQARYEVRFDWGVEGLRSVAPGAGVIVLVEVLEHPDVVARDDIVAEARAFGVPVLRAGLRNRRAVASWVIAHQKVLGRRAMVAVVAAGGERPCVEDLLGAGAVVDALSALGVDACSPEAAAAASAFIGLERALVHLLTASATGAAMVAAGLGDEVRAAAALDADEALEVEQPG